MTSNLSHFLLLLLFLLFSHLPSASPHRHPFDPLTPAELTTVADKIKSSILGSSNSLTFQYVGLDEPDKPIMLAYLTDPSPPPPRHAFVIARSDKQTHEIYVDIANNSIISDRIYGGFGYPQLTFEEQTQASLLPMNYTPFVESVKKRGVQMEDVVCTTFTVGWFGEVERGKRTIKILCFVTGESVNLYVRPLEGVTVVVDLDDMVIVEYEDRMVVPVPTAAGTDYRASRQKLPLGPRGNPVTVVQPEGKGFEIDGHMIRFAANHMNSP